jgi:hypothetical protein
MVHGNARTRFENPDVMTAPSDIRPSGQHRLRIFLCHLIFFRENQELTELHQACTDVKLVARSSITPMPRIESADHSVIVPQQKVSQIDVESRRLGLAFQLIEFL